MKQPWQRSSIWEAGIAHAASCGGDIKPPSRRFPKTLDALLKRTEWRGSTVTTFGSVSPYEPDSFEIRHPTGAVMRIRMSAFKPEGDGL